MTALLPPPPPPPPPPSPPGPPSRGRLRRFLRAAALGTATGLAVATGLAYALTGSIGPPPPAPDVCHRVAAAVLATPHTGVSLAVICDDIDTELALPLGGPEGFEAVMKAPAPPAGPATVHPDYLVWESDGCTAPVLGGGPFDFNLACHRHDFGWRNLKAIHSDRVPVWTVDNKDRVDAGFLWDMRTRCAAVSPVLRIGCDTAARIYYTAVRLNPSGVHGLPWQE